MKLGWVSIITVYYNRVNYVVDSINSLINQTYSKKIIYIIDDCSTDGTPERIISEFSNIKNLHIIKNTENKGLTKNLIDIIDSIETEFIAIHGAGDISNPNRITRQIEILQSDDCIGVVSSSIKAKYGQVTYYNTKDLIKKNRITHGAATIRLSAYKEVGGYRLFFKFRQDKDLWLRMSLLWKICVSHDNLYKLVNIEDSLSKKDPGTVIPTLLSDYSIILIKQRIAHGVDDLDLYGVQGALMYNPASSRGIFIRHIYVHLRSGKTDAAIKYAYTLIKIENSIGFLLVWSVFLLPALYLMNAGFELAKKFGKFLGIKK